MGSDIFKKIANLIDSESAEKRNDDNNVEVVTNDGIEKKENLKNAVITVLKSCFKGDKYKFDDKKLVLHISDSIFYEAVNNIIFVDELKIKILDELGIAFKDVRIDNDVVSDENTCTSVMSNILMEMKDIEVNTIGKTAIISVLNNCGSLVGDVISIDTEYIKKLPKQRVNIGRGKNSTLNDGSYRENFIAICDDEQSFGYEYNKHVSRCHAYIKYNDGFYLYVEIGGCQISHGRTRVFRGGELFKDMNNPKVPVKLENGDVIELAKSVNLLFSFID